MTLNESIKKQQERFDRHFQEINIAPERLILGSPEAVKDFLSSAIREVVKEFIIDLHKWPEAGSTLSSHILHIVDDNVNLDGGDYDVMLDEVKRVIDKRINQILNEKE